MALEMGEETFTRSRNGREGDVDEERRLVRMLVGGSMIRRRRLRPLLLAHLFRDTRSEEEGEEESEREGGATDEERRLVRLLIGRNIMRRRRLRRLLLAHILSERREEESEDEEGGEEYAEDGGGRDEERRLVRLM